MDRLRVGMGKGRRGSGVLLVRFLLLASLRRPLGLEGVGKSIRSLRSSCMLYSFLLLFFQTGQKLYSKQTVYDAHLKSKKHEKAVARLQSSTATTESPSIDPAAPPSSHSFAALRQAKLRPAALLTYQTRSLLLSPEFTNLLIDTKANVERRSALTARERELELVEPVVELAPVNADGNAGEEEDDEEEKIYNPLKLPLGWDGKPIPYWLYKLHGLGQEFTCEICSGYKYMGRKNFEKHFQVRPSHLCLLSSPLSSLVLTVFDFILTTSLSSSIAGVETRVRHARARPAKHQALPRDHKD